jgi:hypothetical protein
MMMKKIKSLCKASARNHGLEYVLTLFLNRITSATGPVKQSEVDDDFFNLDEFNKWTEQQEALDMDSDREDDDDEIDFDNDLDALDDEEEEEDEDAQGKFGRRHDLNEAESLMILLNDRYNLQGLLHGTSETLWHRQEGSIRPQQRRQRR